MIISLAGTKKTVNVMTLFALAFNLAGCAHREPTAFTKDNAFVYMTGIDKDIYESEKNFVEKAFSKNDEKTNIYERTYVLYAVFEGITPESSNIFTLGCKNARACVPETEIIKPGTYRLTSFLLGYNGVPRPYEYEECGDITFEAKKGEAIFLGKMVGDKPGKTIVGIPYTATPKFISTPVDPLVLSSISGNFVNDVISPEQVKTITPKPADPERYSRCKGY